MSKHILVMGESAASAQELAVLLRTAAGAQISVSVAPPDTDPATYILQQRPDLIFTEALVQSESCWGVLERAAALGADAIRFVVCGGRDFDTLYQAMKKGASDYLILPATLEKIQEITDSLITKAQDHFVENAVRRFFLNDKGSGALLRGSATIEQVNAIYGTNFIHGTFRMIFIKFDFPFFMRSSKDLLHLDIGSAEDILRDRFHSHCADIVTIPKADGIMAVLNYRPEDEEAIERELKGLFQSFKARNSGFDGVSTTLCLSSTTDDPCDIGNLKEQVRDAEWARMKLGLDRIIRSEECPPPLSETDMMTLEQLLTEATSAVQILNASQFARVIHEMYALQEDILSSREFRLAMRKIFHFPYEIYWSTIEKFEDPAGSSDQLSFMSHLCTTFKSQESLVVTEYSRLIELIAQYAGTRYSKSVASAISFVTGNIGKKITLADAAEEVGLSECYLSQVFKKETGVNFSKFVQNFKTEKASNMLIYTHLTISEIAWNLGYDKVQDFSKHFSRAVGITPSKFRQLHGVSGRDTHLVRQDTGQSDYLIPRT